MDVKFGGRAPLYGGGDGAACIGGKGRAGIKDSYVEGVRNGAELR